MAKKIQVWINAQEIADVVSCPPDHSPFIPGLAHKEGFVCNAVTCNSRTASQEVIERHCSKEHSIDSRQKQRERQAYSTVTLQHLFAKAPEYFIVNPDMSAPSATTSPPPSTQLISSSLRSLPSSQVRPPISTQTLSSALSIRLRSAVEQNKARYRQVGEPQHVSEITPWLRKTRFHLHVAGIDGALIETSTPVPRRISDDTRLYLMSCSIDRVLRRAYELVADLHHVDARTLNTFQVGTISQDPFQGLQEKSSLVEYIRLFQQLVCYIIRTSEGHFDRDMFIITEAQRQALNLALEDIEALASLLMRHSLRRPRAPLPASHHQHHRDEHFSRSGSESGGDDQGQLEAALDSHVFQFCIQLVTQLTKQSVYDSGVVSFCAVAAANIHSDDKSITWKSEGLCGGILSKLIYDCQLLVLQQAYFLVDEQDDTEIGDALGQLCRAWIINNTRGPVGALNDWRLFAMKVAQTTVAPASIRWDDDGETLHYASVRYSIDDLSREIVFCLEEAREIFERDLCLGFSDVPSYPLERLQDNWSAARAGYSFKDDPRNAHFWEGHDEWLLHHIAQDVDHVSTVFHADQISLTESAPLPFRSEFAKQYLVSVEKFLECMLVLVHKGSGQPARRVEFLGTRWRNIGTDLRNLFLHSGHVVFILKYHKSQSRTHASRYPARFLMPEVGQKLVQFLVLVHPFLLLMSHDVGVPSGVCEYIWSHGPEPWPDDRMTRILQGMSRRSIGTTISVAAWRQIAVGIAIKKFSGQQYEGDIDLPGNPDDDNGGEVIVADGISLPAAFHFQASHTPYTGNQAYGGTVNFSAGLTDAGLQAYHHASQLWWTLYRRHLNDRPSRKRARPPSLSHEPPSLLKRVAHRVRAPRHLRRWGSETVLAALKRLYQDPQAQFRSPIQQQMVEMVAARHAEVVVILATGGGKSLAFMVPMLLPQATTTVVVVPLVALKQDLVRRCWDAGIEYSVWDAHGSSERFTGTPLIFVSAEQAVRDPFHRFLGSLEANQQLDRVVFDECHLILTASKYRPKMALLRHLRQFRCQVVFLSATLPPVLTSQFQSRMLLDQPRVIRDVTFRSDLFYDFHRQSKKGDFQDYAVHGITHQVQSLAHDDQARIIVYVTTRDEAREVAARLECEYYHSNSGPAEEKEQAMARWRDGIHRVIVATSAFGTGVDYAHVRVVIHLDLPTDAINFAQEVGRVGRDGQGGTSFVILPHTFMPINDDTWAHEQHVRPLSERVMQRYVSHSRCLWATLSRYVDGAEKMQYCGGSGLRCGVCRVRGVFHPEEEVDRTWYWDCIGTPGLGETDRTADGDEEEEEEDQGDQDDRDDGEMDETALALQAGSQRLRLSERVAADQRARYLERCQRWRGTCLICQLLRGGQGLDHNLDTCHHHDRVRFFKAKTAAHQGRHRVWMKDHVACWSCGQLPTICDGQKGPRGCEFRDLVLPGAWAAFHMRNLWGHSLAEVSGRPGGFEQEEAWTSWLGEECEVFGERGTQGVRILAWLLEQMERGEGMED